MKSVLINAATLPIYHYILSHLLTDAVTHGTTSMGYDTQILHEDTESYFHNLKPTLTKGRMLLRIARAERRVIGTMQLALCPKLNGPNHVKV
ncbi:hypothetical protein [Serratia symbiotica]|uniref:hypothetical protein n=1 Tax=Serratia symbiotica TaxID=138074 RepID=UPI003EC02DA7